MLKKGAILLSVFILSFLFFSAFSVTDKIAGDNKYVGAEKCAMCHKGDAKGKQFEIWQDSKHSQAFKNLQTPEADKIAKDKGLTTAAAESPQCIKCHVLGKDLNPAEIEESFDKSQGVQCETCHGPGSQYKTMSIMKDKQKAVEAGLMVHSDVGAFCATCHNSESPTFKSFNFDESWAKIKHSKP